MQNPWKDHLQGERGVCHSTLRSSAFARVGGARDPVCPALLKSPLASSVCIPSVLFSKQTRAGVWRLLALRMEVVSAAVERHRIDKAVFSVMVLKMQH